ncbi:polycystin-1 [Hippoglossus hippoglossus]|uniref:polycystin-1 n=1 Tax=Hippoglossus hippoglossus TaxID=8267 RepID=UPI00148C3574|nr:polycystin-1 [Hippoglossus hippoglossus]
MTGAFVAEKQVLPWILCLVLITVAGEEVPCPEGGGIHLSSMRCYWMSEATSSWPEAQHSCRESPGGDLASADSAELQTFLHSSFPVKTTVWVWLKGLRGEGSESAGAVEPVSPARWAGGSEGGCTQMALGALGQWRRAQCAGRYLYLCEKGLTEALPPMDSYLTGLVHMSGIYTQTQIQPLLSIPDIGQQMVEMQLFPGLWFSHAGQLVKVKLVVQPSPLSSLARVQILRPYCDPNHHLVPPGCSSLLNPFSCCSPVPLCNTTGGCSVGQYWCHLLEACVPNTSPCSPYDSAASGRGFALPPRYPAIPPFYHLVADLSLRIRPSSELQTMSVLLPDAAIMVYPDDIIAIQHTRDSGTFLHCRSSEASRNSSWRQSYLSLRGAEWGGWWQGGLTSPSQGGQWVDGVVCDLSILYIDTFHRGTELDGIFGSTHTETNTPPDVSPLTTAPPPHPRSKFRLNVIHPLPDKNNQIHVQINTPTLIVVKVLTTQRARSSWSAPVLQTGVPLLSSCPEEVAPSPPGCKRQSPDEWFSSVTLLLPSVGVQVLNISVVDAVSAQSEHSVSVKVCGYEAVTGLSVEPYGRLRMLTDTSQSFTAEVESGSSVKFTWVIDNLEQFAFEGESYSVAFKRPAEYKLKVTASNPVSSQSLEIFLVADELTPLAEPEFLFVREVVAVNATHLYTLRVKVDIYLPVTFRWDFGDGIGKVSHTQAAPYQTMDGLVERGEKQMFVQDSVNYTYSYSGDLTLHVQVSNQFDDIGASMKIIVRPKLGHVHISSSPAVPTVNHTLLLEAAAEPSNFGVFYKWDFGDGSKGVQGIHHKVRHTFGSAGLFNVTVCANNTLATLTTRLILEVMEEISGLNISYSEPSEVNSATDFRAKVATGTSLIWDFDFGDGSLLGNLTDGSISHIYKSPGDYTVVVTVSNSVSKAQQSIRVEVYSLAVSGVLPIGCIINGTEAQLTALVTGKISFLIFHWQFGDESPVTVVTGQSTAMHSFPRPGIFHVSLTVFSLVSSVSLNTSVCVEAPITNVTVESSQDAVAVGEEVCFRVLVSPDQVTGYQFKWSSNSFIPTAKMENYQKCFVFKDEGVEEVSVMASNNISKQTAKVSITVQKPVSKLSVGRDSQTDALTVNSLVSFWVANCSGSNVSVLWDFGDGSLMEPNHNVSHVFTSTGQFAVTATASNLVSRESASIKVNVLLPVADVSLHSNQPYAAVGEETLITAVSSAISGTSYYWTVDGLTSTKQGTYQFRFAFPKPGVYQVRVVAQNLVSRREAAIFIEVFERIEGLHIECPSLTIMKYAPTQEELLFIASVTKGSNVTYHWRAAQSGINQEITGDGKLFHLLAETPGGLSVHVRASNTLGEATTAVSLVAVERVTSAHVTTHSNIVALGKLVNISVSVVTGSDLEYLWYTNFDPSPLRTREPFLLHNCTSLGDCLVTVVVQNVLSQCNDTKQLIVQEDVHEVDFEIEGKTRPFYINASAAISLRGLVRKGSDLHWDWEVRRSKTNIFNATNQTFIYTFTHPDMYQVSLNVSNGINWQMVSHRVTVQDGIKDLLLNISKSSLCSEEEVTFIPTISKGSNVSFVITLKNKDWIHSQAILEGQNFSISLPAGRYFVTVEAWNLVSSTEVSSSILVTEHIQGLRLVNSSSAALEALKGIHFKAEVQSGFPVNYTWMLHLVGSKPTWLIGQEVIFTPPESGSLSVSVVANNGVCSQMLNETASVEWPVKEIKLVCLSERTFVGHTVMFSATVRGGSNLRYLWDFGDSTKALVTDLRTVNHTYYIAGEYSVVAKVVNGVSHVSTQLHMEVEELQCSSPQASLVQSQATIYRSRPSFFEASVDINCSVYKTIYQWEIFRGSNFTTLPGNKVFLRRQVDAASPLLLLPRHTLDVGQYCLVFTVTLQETPVYVQRTAIITVVHSPLVAVIKGGSHKLWPSLSDLTLDGSESYDPDAEPGVEDTLEYHWTFMRANSTESHFVKQPIESNNSTVTLFTDQLHPSTVYIFTLAVHKAGRKAASVNQTVTVCEAPVLRVTVECVSCSGHSSSQHISYNSAIILAGRCEQCDDQTQYKWSAEVQTGMTLDLDDVAPSTGTHSPNLVVRSGVLQPGLSYTFTLNVSQPGGGQWGSASQTIQPNNPPHGGVCDLRPESDIRLLETVVTYNCSGWRDDDSEASQLIYTFQVAPCQPISTECPTLTLYRGTRSTFGSLVPMGRSGQEKKQSLITVTVLVEDHLGSNVIALNRTLTTENPAMDEITSEWLRNKSQTEFWALVQHGNPQELIPYSIALSSQLNQMTSERTPQELMDRREIRVNVSQALASLPVSSILDVDQISSALAQATAVPDELVCEGCQEKVLEAVGRMILVMEEQMSPGVLAALETGRNILHVLGSTLAAVSESASASSSHPAYSSSLLSASTLALSALAHAGALMRTLMRSRVHGEDPLLLSTPYINTVGFQGDPTDLLCTRQTNQSNQHQAISSRSSSADGSKVCPFHIPTSLTAHLRSQRSEVVQVLFSTDGALESNPMLSATDPPISTSLVAMELTTPQGQPIPIRNLAPEQAIQVTLPNKYPVGQGDKGADGREGECRNETCLTVTLPTEGQLNFTVNAVDGLDENAGLYISFNFSLLPGSTSVSSGYVKIEVSSTVPGTNASLGSLEKEWALSLSAPTSSSEETIFLSPLLHGTDEPLSVNLTSSVPEGGPVHVSVCVFSSLCQYYSVEERRWSSEGLQPLEGSTLQAAHCLTQHLTIFGASLFVHPGAVVLLPPSGGPVRNSVVGIVCAVLVLTHLLVGLIAHKLDHLDSLRLSQVPLCGRPGLYHYRVLVKTGWRRGAGTTAHVGISLYGVNKSGSRHLQRDGAFQPGSLDQFHLETDDNLGEVWKIRIWHDNTGLDPSWYVQHVVVWDPQTDHMFFFVLEDWLSVENQKNDTVEKEVLASCPEELRGFRRVLTSQLMFGVKERHLWLSLWERPAHSRFTRGQRVTCGALMLHLYLALGALWFGAVGSKGISGPVSAQLLVNMETVAMGMTVAALVFPLQCFLCFLFRKAHSQVTVDISVPPSPICHSVEMDVYFGQSKLSSSSLLSLPDSSSPTRGSPSSLLESKMFDSSILDFWASSGLAPQTDRDVVAWPSCDSLLNLPVDLCPAKMTPAHELCKSSPTLGPTRQLRRKKALMQLCLASPSSPDTPITHYPLSKETSESYPSPTAADQELLTMNANPVQTHNHNLTTFLTLSEEDLLMSIAAAAAAAEDRTHKTNSNSDSGRDSPRTTSSFTATQSTSCSSWSDQSEDKSLCGAEILMPDSQSSSQYEAGLYKCPSVLSVDSVASTFLPSPSPDSTRSSSTTRIGVSRGQPRWLLPPWTLRVIYPLVAALLGACLAVVGLYGTFFSRNVVLMWLISAFSAFLTSALLLEPLKVCVQALIYTVLWRPVDPEVEDQLAQETTVVRAFGEHSAKVRPPCGYGLLQAKDEARKVRALRSLMRHCVCQLLFLLLVLMVNYQDGVEERQGRLLQSALRGHLRTAPLGAPNLTSLRDWSDAEQWINHTLVPQLHQNPSLRLVGLPQLQYTGTLGHAADVLLGNSSERTRQLLADLHMMDWGKKMFETLSIDFTHYNKDSGLFVCVSIQLQWAHTQRVTSFLSIHPLLIPSPSSGLDFRVALTVLLLISALLILLSELWSMVTEHAQYLHHCRHWFQLFLAFLLLATAILQFCFLSRASSCVSELRNRPDNFIDFHKAALLAQRSSQCAAVLLTLLVLKLLGTLRFVRRWLVIGRVLQRAWGELWAVTVLLLLLLMLCTHLGNMLFSHSVEGFQSVHEAGVSVLSVLRGRIARQRLCKVHTVLGPLHGLLLMGGGLWLLARLCGAVLIRAYRAEQAELYHPTIEPQDYEMVEFFIKRLKLWMGLSKAKEFRHSVKFEGMDIPPSRSSQESRLSTLSSTLPSYRSPSLSSSFSSPRPLSSALSVRSEDSSVSEPGFDVLPYLDRLLPSVGALLSHFDRVNQITEDVHNLEMKLEEAQTRRRERWISNDKQSAERFEESTTNPKEPEAGMNTGEIRHRKTSLLYPKPRVSLPSSFSFNLSTLHSSAASICIFPRTRGSCFESDSVLPQASSDNHSSDTAKSASGICGLYPAGSPSFGEFPRRRAWHSGSSHSADAAQRAFQLSGGAPLCGNGGEHLTYMNDRPRSEEGVKRRISDGVPVKRKAWISEGPETEQD